MVHCMTYKCHMVKYWHMPSFPYNIVDASYAFQLYERSGRSLQQRYMSRVPGKYFGRDDLNVTLL